MKKRNHSLKRTGYFLVLFLVCLPGMGLRAQTQEPLGNLDSTGEAKNNIRTEKSMSSIETEMAFGKIGQTHDKSSSHARLMRKKKKHKRKSVENDSQFNENTLGSTENPHQKLSVTAKKSPVAYKNVTQFVFNNSAYRPAGGDFPVRSMDYILNPTLSGSCFNLESCELSGRIEASTDLHNEGKSSLEAFSLGLKIAPKPWGQMIKPELATIFHIPTTEKEIHDEKLIVGTTGILTFGTTPEFTGSDFFSFVLKTTIRKNTHARTRPDSIEWASRQSLGLSMNITKSLELSFGLGHIWNQKYSGEPEEVLEWSQGLGWEANKVWSFFIEHNNGNPMFGQDGQHLDASIISVERSVISTGVRITHLF